MAAQYDSLGNIVGMNIPSYNLITADDDNIVIQAKREVQLKQYNSQLPTADTSYVLNSTSSSVNDSTPTIEASPSAVLTSGLGTTVANEIALGTTVVKNNTDAASQSDKATSTLTTVANPTGVGTNSNYTAGTGSTSSFNINSQYQSGNYRLVDFSYNTGGDDNSKRSYMRIRGNTELLKKSLQSNAVNYTQLQSLFNTLINKYTAFILVGIQENLQERQSIMQTVGDSFAATFSGADPQVLALNGILPFDNQSDKSWFIYFMNAYTNFLRASKLAKYKCYLELVLPDYQTYKCYPISITCALQSDSDTIVNFGMQAVVMNDWSNKAYGYSTAALNYTTATSNSGSSNTSVVGSILSNALSTDKATQIQSGETSTATLIGDIAKKTNWWGKAVSLTNSALSKAGTVDLVKTYEEVIKLKGRGWGSL